MTAHDHSAAPGRRPPSLLEQGPWALRWRETKVALLQAERLLRWAAQPARWPAPQVGSDAAAFPHLVWERRLPLRRSDGAEIAVLEEGKRVNLALAAPAFDGLVLSAARPLSFWRTLGRVSAGRGFQAGMELRGGCIVPALGGGLCLLSNALFVAAVELGWTILERHGHTLEAVPPPPDELWGLDATVFWPYVDLRVAPPGTTRAWLRVAVEGDELRLRVFAESPRAWRVTLRAEGDRVEEQDGERLRHSRVLRRIEDLATGALVAEELVAVNRKRLLHQHEQQRSCLTCGEAACAARPALLRSREPLRRRGCRSRPAPAPPVRLPTRHTTCCHPYLCPTLNVEPP